MQLGSEFQTVRAATEKAQVPSVLRQYRGISVCYRKLRYFNKGAVELEMRGLALQPLANCIA